MRILIVQLSPVEANSSAVLRTLALARGLAEAGNQVDFLCTPMGGVQVRNKNLPFMNEINVIRTSKANLYSAVIDNKQNGGLHKVIKSVLRKIWHTFSVYDNTCMIAKNLKIDLLPAADYDLVISSSDPKTSHIAVQKLRQQGLTYKRWIEYWGDPLAIDITQKSIYPRFILKRIEKKLLTGADKIVYVSPFTLNQQEKLFPALKDKMTFLPVPYMEEEVFPETHNDQFVIGYYGDYGTKVRNLQPFYDACVEMGNKVSVGIYGSSDLRLESTDYIQIHPRGIIDEHKKTADLLVCVMNRKGTQIPGKLYHLAGTNKKVLVIIEDDHAEEMVNYLRSFDRYYICRNDSESILKALKEIIADKKNFAPVKKLKYDVIAQKFIE